MSASKFYSGPTALKAVRDDVLTTENSEDFALLPTVEKDAIQEDFDKRLIHLRQNTTPALIATGFNDSGEAEDFELNVTNLYAAIRKKQPEMLAQIVRVYRSSTAKSDQISVLGKININVHEKASTLMKNEIEAIQARLTSKTKELNLAQDAKEDL